MSADPVIEVLGIRHHGPGSARAVRAELERLEPDLVLVEGPPEADALLPLAADPAMEPPVALLAHGSGKAAFWPFAAFSPEWQAIRYALGAGAEVRFCDLPAAHLLALGDTGAEDRDPIAELAAAAGHDDPEAWWEDMVEHRGEAGTLRAVAEAMIAIREGHVPQGLEAVREAHMRAAVRRAVREGFRVIAVVCGAWHLPALREPRPAADDDRLLTGLPKIKIEMTWVPWTYGRLATAGGYRAGVASPGWYDHLFTAPDRPVERWLARAAAILREEDLPVSSAHVIEAARLADALAVLRGRPVPGLAEATEAVRAVLCEGAEAPLALIQSRMVVGERLGRVPDATPMVPLQRDLRAQQRRLRLTPTAEPRDLDLDLRKPTDLARSRLLHRLGLLGVAWGTRRPARGKGTFKEPWTVQWRPEFDLALIEAGAWGLTVEEAATARARELATAPRLADLTELAERCLLAHLPDALPDVLGAIRDRAARDADVRHLMEALPALARARRYGDVRGTEGLPALTDSLLTRIYAGLAPAVVGLDDDAAREMAALIDRVHAAAGLLGGDRWLAALADLARRSGLPGVIEGRVVRILFDAGMLGEDIADRLARAMSPGNPPAWSAGWLEGLLSGGGMLLVHDPRLLVALDGWLTGLTPEAFVDVLPVLRRAFGAFPAAERRLIGERVLTGGLRRAAEDAAIDDELAAPAVRTVLEILARA
ncbi:DUF5682 family protein [Thermobispora bispora]|uniref:DUF5682 family protein n=1 Tax=Thermobispora bispora TaxID=2006 RepID=UPI00333EDE27